MTIQAQRAVRQMLAAGFKRSEFEVKTEKKHGGYGDAKIRYRCATSKVLERKDAILSVGLGLRVWRIFGESEVNPVAIITTEYKYEGKFEEYLI
jgi:hypothetical protein